MSAKVDVLEVIATARTAMDPIYSVLRSDLSDAHDAVAELIEAANRARNILALHDDRCPQLDAALARIGGAS